VLDDGDIERTDVSAIRAILDILKSARQAANITLHQRRIIVLQSTRRRRGPRPPG